MAIKYWDQLSHQDKIDHLKKLNDDEIIQNYKPDGIKDADFRRLLERDRNFWQPQNIKELKYIDESPSKDTTIGAWRDLSRAEAILELIDNSIDAWNRRRIKYPSKTPKELNIYIDVDDANKILTYEDNAGGVPMERLVNLIVPGHSETSNMDHTIGSYKTGGKKAIFKLAEEAVIWTRFWNPVGTTDEAFEIHLDSQWLTDPTEYRFGYAELKDKAAYQKGQTIYKFRLHREILEWNTVILKQIVSEIRRSYSLLLIRNPKIKIFFNDRNEPLHPYTELYKFTDANDQKSKLDLRPQQMKFKAKVDIQGESREILIEVVLGCRTTTGTPTTADEQLTDMYGIDLYGNDRLFLHHEYDLFREWFGLPAGNVKTLVRGYINIIGPNDAIPWDTHKRHLNADRKVVDLLKSKPVKEFFQNWIRAYNNLSGAPDIKKKITNAYKPVIVKNDINIPNSRTVTITQKRDKLPTDIHKPFVPKAANSKKKPIQITLNFSQSEFNFLCKDFGISPDDSTARKQLQDLLQSDVISKISK